MTLPSTTPSTIQSWAWTSNPCTMWVLLVIHISCVDHKVYFACVCSYRTIRMVAQPALGPIIVDGHAQSYQASLQHQ